MRPSTQRFGPKVSSPCTKVCKLKKGRCMGCGRSAVEIQEWKSMTEQHRQEIIKANRSKYDE